MEFTDIGLYLMYVMVSIAAIAAIAFPVMHIAKDKNQLKNALIWLGGFLLLVIVGYIFSSSEIPQALQKACQNFKVSEGEFRFIGTGLNVLYIMLIGSAAALIYSEAKNLVK